MSTFVAETEIVPETGSYHLPSQGVVTFTLRRESAALFRLLRAAREIDRLKRLDHLGTIRMAWEGAHHPRWEYVVSILNLICRCEETPEVHLKTSVTLPTGETFSSGAELLKSWALLANLGHLNGTFASERALLFQLTGERRTDYLAFFRRDRRLRDWVMTTLDQARIYTFFQTIAFVRLGSLFRRTTLPDGELDGWWNTMRAYVLHDGASEQLAALKNIYRNLRRIAFLALDSHYTPSFARLDIARVINDQRALTRFALRDPREPQDDLQSIEQHLYRDIYLGSRALEAVLVHEERVTRALDRMLPRLPLANVVQSLSRRPEMRELGDFETILRLGAWMAPPWDQIVFPRADNLREEQQRASAYATERSSQMRAIFWVAAYGSDWVLQTMARRGNRRDALIAFMYGFAETARRHRELSQRWDEWPGGASHMLHRVLFDELAVAILSAGLGTVFARAVRWEWTPTRTGFRGRVGPRREVREALARVGEGAERRARQDELEGLSRRLRYRPDDYVVSTEANVEAFPEGGRAKLAELDGVLVELRGEQIVVTLVETKRLQRSVVSRTQEALLQKLATLEPRSDVVVSDIETERRGRVATAWVELRPAP